MAKFNIDETAADKITNKAALKDNTETVLKDFTLRKIPKAWADAIKTEAGQTFAAYARAAVLEKMKRDGLIS